MSEKPVINCHTHVFSGESVPPWLAKQFVPWPFYYLLPVTLLVKLCRAINRFRDAMPYKPWYKKLNRTLYACWIFVNRNYIALVLHTVLGIALTYHVFFFIWDWLSPVMKPEGSMAAAVSWLREKLSAWRLLLPLQSTALKLLCLVVFLTLFPSGRNLVLFVLKKTWKFLSSLPGKQTLHLLERYMTLGRFAFHKEQATILSKLVHQYGKGTQFIILPMDMDYMGAGKAPVPYLLQLQELADLKGRDKWKDVIHPFIFADPRRMAAQPDYFRYRVVNGKVELEDCIVKTCLETKGFAGIKIYPALGYFPFDARLLPLYKYAADNGIPIMTHCIKGTIFYRGKKEKAWDEHPVFEQAMHHGEYRPLLLPQKKNIDFTLNFTHPLNYLCLLDPSLLAKLVAKDPFLYAVFGYDPVTGCMTESLSHLKLCFGHFGGEDQWERFLEHDRENHSARLFTHPQRGIEFLKDDQGNPSPGKPEQLWKWVDWYSIICSLMLQYDNVYADISYILHDGKAVFPLLKHTLQHETLKTKVLYGTDFYVVRNHKSDKNLHALMLTGLSEQEFDLIARINPTQYLR